MYFFEICQLYNNFIFFTLLNTISHSIYVYTIAQWSSNSEIVAKIMQWISKIWFRQEYPKNAIFEGLRDPLRNDPPGGKLTIFFCRICCFFLSSTKIRTHNFFFFDKSFNESNSAQNRLFWVHIRKLQVGWQVLHAMLCILT